MKRVYVPAKSVEDWKPLLAEPEKQWKDGYSAKRLAQAWQEADSFPAAVASVLAGAEEPLRSLAPLLILPEHQVALPGGQAASQSDVWVLASHALGLASIVVEGKVSETFGPLLSEWLVNASEGKRARLAFLMELLGLPEPVPDGIRYQLLHRMASAILEARRFRANVAVCILHSFSPTNEHFDDFAAFCRLFGKSVQPGEIVKISQRDGILCYVMWAQDCDA